MILSDLRWWHYLVGIVVGLSALFALAVYLNHHTFRFRMTLEVEADGKVHTGSSIIEVTYSPGGYQTKRWPTEHRGVTPMVDLGPHGTVMAARLRGMTACIEIDWPQLAGLLAH